MQQTSSSPALPDTLGQAIEVAARAQPAKVFLRCKHESITFGEFDARCNRLANGLGSLGVGHGRFVAVMLPNGIDFVLTWFALAKLGAVTSAVSTEFRGPGLAHMLNATGASILIVSERYVGHVGVVAESLQHVDTLYVRTEGAEAGSGLTCLPTAWRVNNLETLYGSDVAPPESPARWPDPVMTLFTSGTTGRSKACVISHRFALRQAQVFLENMGLNGSDTFYCPFPLFHADATLYTVIPAVLLQTTAALGERFSVSRFWQEVRDFGATTFDFMGATLTLLHKQPRSAADSQNPARLGWGIPMPEFADEFENRFNLKLLDGFGMTECGVVIFQPRLASSPPGSSGKVVAPYEVRIVDEDDVSLPAGSVGEIVVRGTEPSVMTDGYYGQADATVALFRNGWLHTGDLGSFDDEGYFYFRGRKKDVIRRRGENLSAYEVEEAVNSHPAVLESAAIGVASEMSEQDLKIFVVLRPRAELQAQDLMDFLSARLARAMLPRYVQYVDALPKTPTEKIAKHLLESLGAAPDTWDGERPR